MFSKKNKITKNNIVEVADFLNKKSIPSIIVSDLNIQGDLISEGAIEIGGIVNGNVKCNFVTIRKGAKINGNVVADNLVINGAVEGIMQAKHLSVTSSAVVKGTLEYGFLSVESGADIKGKLVRKQYKDLESVKEIEQEAEFVAKIDDIFSNKKQKNNALTHDNSEVLDVTPVNNTKKKKNNKASSKKAKAKS
ncbi:MAG: bactofilin family protein [Rickettsiales bacterium]